MFQPLITERLVIRSATEDDAERLHHRRNDPLVAKHQNWKLPYPMEQAQGLVAEVAALGEPTQDQWWMAIVDDRITGETVGDLAVRLIWQGRSAEIGYTLDSSFWGRGYATESVAALVAWLFEHAGVTRISAMTHPENRASAMVLERCGFGFEGHTKLSYWVGDEASDDWIFGLVRDDWSAWLERPVDPPQEILLVEITPDNMEDVYRLRTHKTQEDFVASMPDSFADALFPEVIDGAAVVPWMRAVVGDGQYVGFVMLALSTVHHSDPYLWRLLIDRNHQRRGLGGVVLDSVAAECRNRGDRQLLTSWVEGKGSPANFYLRRGFVPTGRIIDGEIEAALGL